MKPRKSLKSYDQFKLMVEDWANKDARLIRDRGEGRLKWRDIRWRTINCWSLSPSQKKSLYDYYVVKVEEKAPVIIPKAPERPRIAVSAF